MIKIEFKEAQPMLMHLGIYNCFITTFIEYKKFHRDDILLLYALDDLNKIKNITLGSVSELVPSRDEVLAQLGISKEQDEEMQQKYK